VDFSLSSWALGHAQNGKSKETALIDDQSLIPDLPEYLTFFAVAS
jgi:hypothetical protein